MFFSQLKRIYHCPNCQYELSRGLPTSLAPMVLVWWGSAVLAYGGLIQTFGWWQSLLAALILPLVTLALGLVLVFQKALVATQPCPECLHLMKAYRSGLVSGDRPLWSELFCYGVTLLLAYWVFMSFQA